MKPLNTSVLIFGIVLSLARLQALTVAPTDNTAAPYMGVYEWSLTDPNNPPRIEYTANWLARSGLWAEEFCAFDAWDQLRGPGWLFGPVSDWKAAYPDRKLIFSLPMLPEKPKVGGPPAWGIDAGVPVSLQLGAAGNYNQHFQRLAERMVEKGLVDNVIIRLGWEFNGSWYPWSVTNSTQAGYYAEYWRQIVDTMHAVEGAENLKFCWNGTTIYTSYNTALAYPGDEYVDYIGVDVYDQSFDTSIYSFLVNATPTDMEFRRKKAWNSYAGTTNGGLLSWRDFAIAHNKPFCIPEWGLVNRVDIQDEDDPNDDIQRGGLDNTYFVQQMYDFIQNPANKVDWHVYFNVKAGDGDHQLTDYNGFVTKFPNASALFQQLFSASPVTETYGRRVATADAEVRSANATTNYGSSDQTGAKSNARETYLRFDVSGLENANKVTLTLTAKSWCLDLPFTCSFVQDDTWGESTIVWNNRPAAGAVLATQNGVYQDQVITFDVTNAVKAEAAGDGILTLKITTSDINWSSFYSRETALEINRPVLEYTLPTQQTGSLLLDQFTDGGADGWTENPAIVWSVVNDGGDNAYKLDYDWGTSASGKTTAGLSTWSDYKVTVDLKILNDEVWSEADVFARYVDSNNYYEVVLADQGTNWKVMYIKKKVNGTVTTLASAPITLNLNTWYTVSFEVNGNQLTAWKDGVQVLQTTDSTFTSGKIGLGGYKQDILFDNVEVNPINNFLLVDQFTDGVADGWTENPAIVWSVVSDGGDNAYKLDYDWGTSAFGFSTVGQANWTDYKVTVDLKILNDQQWSEARILARYIDDNNYYQVVLADQGANWKVMYIKKKVNGTVTTLASASITLNLNTWYTVSFEVNGNQLTAWKDGVQVLQTTDSTFTSGKAGLGGYKQDILFDNVVVE